MGFAVFDLLRTFSDAVIGHFGHADVAPHHMDTDK